MTEMKPPQAMSLFDLIARSWTLGAGVRQGLFNTDGSAVCASLEDGTLTFLATGDDEAPDRRMRLDFETGRMTIRPRERALAPPRLSEAPVAAVDAPVCRLGGQGFAFLHRSGEEIWRATARGQTLRLIAGRGPVSGLCTLESPDRIVVARGSRVSIHAGGDGAELAAADLGHDVSRIAASADGQRLACWGAGHLSIVCAEAPGRDFELPCEDRVIGLGWSPDGRWLAAGCEDRCVLLVDLESRACDRIVDFPAAVTDVEFSRSARALLASGAFRVVGWALPDLPFGDHEGSAVESGRPGLTLVDHVAAHPSRPLCAVAYANGLVTICQIGSREELMLREGGGAAVTTLAWSGDGAHLAIGQHDGAMSITTFPKQMFK